MGKDERTPSIPLAQAPPTNNVYVIRKHGRAFAIFDPAGNLVCMTLYLRGAFEVIRRLGGAWPSTPSRPPSGEDRGEEIGIGISEYSPPGAIESAGVSTFPLFPKNKGWAGIFVGGIPFMHMSYVLRSIGYIHMSIDALGQTSQLSPFSGKIVALPA
jgi:hypothetical protein